MGTCIAQTGGKPPSLSKLSFIIVKGKRFSVKQKMYSIPLSVVFTLTSSKQRIKAM